MKSSDQTAGGGPPVRHYIDLTRDLSQRLNVLAAQTGQTKKQIMEGLIINHLKGVK